MPMQSTSTTTCNLLRSLTPTSRLYSFSSETLDESQMTGERELPSSRNAKKQDRISLHTPFPAGRRRRKKRKRDRKKEKDEGAYHNREAVKCARDTRFHGRQNFLSVVGFSPLFLLCAKYDGFAYTVSEHITAGLSQNKIQAQTRYLTYADTQKACIVS